MSDSTMDAALAEWEEDKARIRALEAELEHFKEHAPAEMMQRAEKAEARAIGCEESALVLAELLDDAKAALASALEHIRYHRDNHPCTECGPFLQRAAGRDSATADHENTVTVAASAAKSAAHPNTPHPNPNDGWGCPWCEPRFIPAAKSAARSCPVCDSQRIHMNGKLIMTQDAANAHARGEHSPDPVSDPWPKERGT